MEKNYEVNLLLDLGNDNINAFTSINNLHNNESN